MWNSVARVQGLGLPSALRAAGRDAVELRVMGASLTLGLDGVVRRRVTLDGDTSSLAPRVAGEWTWTLGAQGCRVRRLVDGSDVAVVPQPGLLGFASAGSAVGVVGESSAVVVTDGLTQPVPGRWHQVAGGAHLWFAGPEGLLRWGASRVQWEAPVRALRVVGPWVVASTDQETRAWWDGQEVALPFLRLQPGHPAVTQGDSLWIAPGLGTGWLQITREGPRQLLLEGRTVLSADVGAGGLAVVAAEGIGSASVVLVRGSTVASGPAVDPWVARVCWVGRHLVCGGVREVAVDRWDER